VRPFLIAVAALIVLGGSATAQKVISPTPNAPAATPSPAPLDQPVRQTDQQQAPPDNRGTDQIPFIVKELPRERSEEEKTDAKEKAALDRRLTEYTGDLAWFTKALFISTLALATVTGALALAAFLQARDSRKSIAAAETAAKAARDNVHATLQTSRVLRNAQRPYLSPFDPKLRNFNQVVHNEDASVVMMTVELDITNVGRGIGFIRSYEIIHEVCARDSQGRVCLEKHEHIARYPLRPEATWILEDTKFSFYAFRINNDQRKGMRDNRNILYLYGNVRYWDLFPVNRQTGFMFEYIPNWESPEKGVFVMCPHAMWYDIEEEPEAQSSGT
jgi:hypothetical protein